MQDRLLLNFDTAADLAQAAAARWLKELGALSLNQIYCVALSGGRIARLFFVEVAKQGRSLPAALTNVHFFWADERCVPPTDAESNFALAQQHLLQPLQVPAGQIHRIRGEEAPTVAAAQAEAVLRQKAPLNQAGVPVLDLVFLGMGEDGHVASIFPNAPAQALHGPPCFLAVPSPNKPPPQRITLTLPVLAAATQVWVLVSGPGKERALRGSLSPGGKTPLALLLQRRRQTLLFTDCYLRNNSRARSKTGLPGCLSRQ